MKMSELLKALLRFRNEFSKTTERTILKTKYQEDLTRLYPNTSPDSLNLVLDAALSDKQKKSQSIEEIESALFNIFSLNLSEEKSKEYAYKLAVTFGDLNQIFSYLEFHKFDTDAACNFNLPAKLTDRNELSKSETLLKWQQLSKNHMKFDWYRRMWSDASVIETSISQEAKESFDKKKNRGEKAKFGTLSPEIENDIQQIKKEITNLKNRYKQIKEKRINRGKDSLSLEESNFYYEFPAKQKELQLKLADKCIGKKFLDFDIDLLVAHYAKLQSRTEDNHGQAYFAKYGIDKKKYEKFYSLNRVDDDEKIPRITIDGEEVGHPGYYLRRLNVEDFDDALLAATLGKHTQCCQSISGEFGEPCAIHGISSPNGGFYIVCRGDAQNPNPQDEVILQSWAWRSKSGAIVFDSIESKERARLGYQPHAVALASAFYNKLTSTLLTDDTYNVPTVSGGIRCGIWGSLLTEHPSTVEQPIDYGGNIDSYQQRQVASKDALYLLEPDGEKLFIQNCNSADDPSTDKYTKMIVHALTYKKSTLLEKYKKLFPTQGQETINQVQRYLGHLGKYQLQSAHIMVKKYPYLLNLQDKNGNNLLMLAIKRGNYKLAETLANNTLCNLNLVNKEGRSALMLAAEKKQWDIVNILLKKNADPNIIDSLGHNLLFLAVKQNNVELLEKLMAQESNIDINARDNQNNTPLMLAAYQGNIILMQKLMANKSVDINLRNRDGETALLLAAKSKNWNVVHYLLQQPNIDINAKDMHGRNLLMYVAKEGNTELFNTLKILGANLSERDNYGQTYFDYDSFHRLELDINELEKGFGSKIKSMSDNSAIILFNNVKNKLENYQSTSVEKMKIINDIKNKMPPNEATIKDKKEFLKTAYSYLRKNQPLLEKYRQEPQSGLGRVLNIFYNIHKYFFGSKGFQMYKNIMKGICKQESEHQTNSPHSPFKGQP